MSSWDTESEKESQKEQPETPEYKVRAHLALEDTDTHDWGLVKDTEGNICWKRGEGQLVGTWSRSPSDGLIHICLETTIMALVDKATLQFAKYAEKRRTEIAAPKARSSRGPRAPKPEPEQSEALTVLDSVRKLLNL